MMFLIHVLILLHTVSYTVGMVRLISHKTVLFIKANKAYYKPSHWLCSLKQGYYIFK